MRRLFLLIFLLALKSDAIECDWTPVEKDSYGCVNFFWYRRAEEFKCSNMPDCFLLCPWLLSRVLRLLFR